MRSSSNQPSEAEMLRQNLIERTSELRKRRDQLLEACARVPSEIETESEAVTLTDFLAQVNALLRASSELEGIMKEVPRSAINIIGVFFTKEFASIIATKAELLARQTKFMKESAAIEQSIQRAPIHGDFGSVATLRTRWVFSVDDYKKLDYVLLSAYLDRESIDKAIRKAITAGCRQLKGVKIYQNSTAVVR
jgi:hypothetical protein